MVVVVNSFRVAGVPIVSSRTPSFACPPFSVSVQRGVITTARRAHHLDSFLDKKKKNPNNPALSSSSYYSRSSTSGCSISRSSNRISTRSIDTTRIPGGIWSSSSKNSNSPPRQRQQVFATSSPRSVSSPPPQEEEDNNEMKMYHLDSIGSTQDEARRILLQDHDNNTTLHETNTCMAITTASQTHGRGTNKRTWIGKRGNTFLTVAVPSDDIQIPVSLLPLQIGVIVAENVNKILYNHAKHPAKITLKWPNDVLINDKKVAGVLIESEKDHAGNYYFLIGIGINYKFAPNVQSIGPERGREATCICDYLDENDGTKTDGAVVEEAKALGIQVAKDIQKWIELQKIWDGAAEDVIAKWENWAKFGQKLVLRDTTGNETVIPLRVEKDGRLRVQGQDGRERLLCFDYLL